MTRAQQTKQPSHLRGGRGQLTLVEHALCPLSQVGDLTNYAVHRTGFQYVDQAGKRRTASAVVTAPFGLRPSDEMFLWGMLGLTLAQPQLSAELSATPHFILRSLGCIDSAGDRGGSAYRAFRESLRRLAAVTYHCNAFYDPAKGEHRETAFGFLSYSLPVDPASNRAWRIVWDPLFLGYCAGARGCLSFDMAIYRTLDPAARRLYLFLAKIFWRRQWTHWIDLRSLSVDVLGFSPTIAIRNLKQKLKRAILRLVDHGIVDLCEGTNTRNLFVDRDQGGCVLRLKRGRSFRRLSRKPDTNAIAALTIYDPLKSIGLDDATIAWIARTFQHGLVQQWADITLAARERQGQSFFKKSPQAYFVDNLRQAAENGRTPPDWWWAYKRAEEQRIDSSLAHQLLAHVSRQSRSAMTPNVRDDNSFLAFLRGDGRQEFERLLQPMFADLCRGGMPADQAHKQATQWCVDHMRRRYLAA
jgi:hypothetical protein